MWEAGDGVGEWKSSGGGIDDGGDPVIYVCSVCYVVLFQAEGIVGTYIANIKSPTTNSGSTVISFDKGGTWLQLSPPYADFTCQKVS